MTNDFDINTFSDPSSAQHIFALIVILVSVTIGLHVSCLSKAMELYAFSLALIL